MAADPNISKLTSVGFVPQQTKALLEIFDAGGGGSIPATDVTVEAIEADNFTFAGGTLQDFAQAIADAIPAEAG